MNDTERLAQAIETLNQHKLMQIYANPWRMMWVNFLRGLAFGLGSVLGATILVYITVQILAQIEFIPILGDWAAQIIGEIESNR
jgi:glucokinase